MPICHRIQTTFQRNLQGARLSRWLTSFAASIQLMSWSGMNGNSFSPKIKDVHITMCIESYWRENRRVSDCWTSNLLIETVNIDLKSVSFIHKNVSVCLLLIKLLPKKKLNYNDNWNLYLSKHYNPVHCPDLFWLLWRWSLVTTNQWLLHRKEPFVEKWC